MFSAETRFQSLLDDAAAADSLGAVINLAARAVSSSTRPSAGDPEREEKLKYYRLAVGFLTFMRYGMKPAGVSDEDFQLLRPVCAALVEKGALLPDVLEMFGKMK
jgi:hypothetical protein